MISNKIKVNILVLIRYKSGFNEKYRENDRRGGRHILEVRKYCSDARCHD